MSGRIFENISRQIDLFRQAKNYLQSNQYKIIRVQPLLFFLFSLYNCTEPLAFCGLLTMFSWSFYITFF